MKYILILLLITSCSSTPYAKVGAGIKFDETNLTWTDSKTGEKYKSNTPFSARFELGFENENWSYGLSHHSQWFNGAPFNKSGEYYKTEIFVDHKWTF